MLWRSRRSLHATVRMVPGVTVLPTGAEGRVHLLQQFRYALGAETWEPLGTVHPGTPIVHGPVRLFVARGLTFTEPARDATEMMQTVRLPPAEAVVAVERGDTVQASSRLLILGAARLLDVGADQAR